MAEPLTAEQLDAIRQDSAMVHLFAHDQIVATIDAQAVEIDRLKKWAILPGYRAVDILELEALMDERDALQAEVARLKAMPDGWVLVPREPTDDMLEEGGQAHQASACMDIIGPLESAWHAMISAVPPVPPAPAYTTAQVMALVSSVGRLRDAYYGADTPEQCGMAVDGFIEQIEAAMHPFTATGQGGER